MRRAQVMGKKTQQHRSLFLGLTLETQVGQAEQPANRCAAISRQQRRQLQSQAASLGVAKLTAAQGRNRRQSPFRQPWITQTGQAGHQWLTHQVIGEQPTGIAVGQQHPAIRAADQGRHRQVLQAVGNKPAGIAGAAHGLFQGDNLSLQHIAGRSRCPPALGEYLGFVIQSLQFPAEIGEHRIQAAPVPDQIAQYHPQQAGHRRPPPTCPQQ